MTSFGSGEGSIFVQPDGPNSKPIFVGCADLGDIDEPLGDVALWLCKDPKAPNTWKTSRIMKGAPGLVATSLTTETAEFASYLEELEDNTPIFLTQMASGRADTFNNYDRAFVTRWIASNRKRSNLATARADEGATTERGEMVVDLVGQPPLYAFFDLSEQALRVSTAETAGLNNIVFSNLAATAGFVAADAAAAATANVLDVADWEAAAADPFAADEHVMGGVAFEIDKNTTRWLVARGSTDAGNPAEIAYSDDAGATWSLVDVGAVDGQYVPDSGSLFALDQNNIWLGTDDGYIYYSDDGGLSWTAQESGTIHSGAYNAIHFRNDLVGMAVGAADVVAYTNDGGNTWAAATATGGGNALTTLGHNTGEPGIWWSGDGGGDLYYSSNDGVTWAQREFSGDGAGNVAAVKFANEWLGVMAHNNATPLGRLLVTIDGGFSWRRLTIPTNAGLNDVWIAGPRKIYAVGEASGGTGYIVKVETALRAS